MAKKIRYVSPESFKKKKMRYNFINSDKKHGISKPVDMSLEEYEALRLSYYQKLDQIECAQHLSESQPTYSRILKSAIEKLTTALVEGRDFEIIGGNVLSKEWIGFGCWDCDYEWKSEQKPVKCPKCGSKIIFPLKKIVTYWE